jgi:hypothetical protein
VSKLPSGARAASAGLRRAIITHPAVSTVSVLALAAVALFAVSADAADSRSAASARGGGRHGFAEARRAVEPSTDEQLPDLDQEVPSELDVRVDTADGRPTFRLGFRSAVSNVGSGPLIVAGSRPDAGTSTMTVDQFVDRTRGPQLPVRGVGQMEYAVSPSHSHWHFLQFDRYQLQSYELRRAGSDRVLVADQKTGFCLGDRYRVPLTLPRAPIQPVYTGRCGLAQPGLLTMLEGISVGYGDDYSGFLEGQDLPLDGLPDGRYLLVHRVNVGRRLQELSYTNDAASVALDLRWEAGRPHLRQLASCPDSDECEVGDRANERGAFEIPLSTASAP